MSNCFSRVGIDGHTNNDIKKTIVAFANADDVILRMPNASRDSIRPDVTLFVACGIEIMEGKKVVAATVQRGTARPYYVDKKGLLLANGKEFLWVRC